MIFEETDIEFSRLDDHTFEELCFDLLLRAGFLSLEWRQGGADKGRDIEGTYAVTLPLVGLTSERWFVECKHYSHGVPVDEITSKIAWADACRPQRFLLVTTGYLSTASRDWLEKLRPSKPYSISFIEGKQLKSLLLGYPDLVTRYFSDEFAVTLQQALRDWTMHGLLPSKESLYLVSQRLDPRKLSPFELSFLLCSYFARADEIAAWAEELDGKAFDLHYLFDFFAPTFLSGASPLDSITLPWTQLNAGVDPNAMRPGRTLVAKFAANPEAQQLDAVYVCFERPDSTSAEVMLTRLLESLPAPRLLPPPAAEQQVELFNRFQALKHQ